MRTSKPTTEQRIVVINLIRKEATAGSDSSQVSGSVCGACGDTKVHGKNCSCPQVFTGPQSGGMVNRLQYHEAMDRVSVIIDTFNSSVMEHAVTRHHEDFHALCDEVESALLKCYQRAGQLAIAPNNQIRNGGNE